MKKLESRISHSIGSVLVVKKSKIVISHHLLEGIGCKIILRRIEIIIFRGRCCETSYLNSENVSKKYVCGTLPKGCKTEEEY